MGSPRCVECGSSSVSTTGINVVHHHCKSWVMYDFELRTRRPISEIVDVLILHNCVHGMQDLDHSRYRRMGVSACDGESHIDTCKDHQCKLEFTRELGIQVIAAAWLAMSHRKFSKTFAEGQWRAEIGMEGGDTFFKEGECCKGS